MSVSSARRMRSAASSALPACALARASARCSDSACSGLRSSWAASARMSSRNAISRLRLASSEASVCLRSCRGGVDSKGSLLTLTCWRLGRSSAAGCGSTDCIATRRTFGAHRQQKASRRSARLRVFHEGGCGLSGTRVAACAPARRCGSFAQASAAAGSGRRGGARRVRGFFRKVARKVRWDLSGKRTPISSPLMLSTTPSP